MGWGVDKIPSLKGKTAIVTGANSGIGYYTALELGRNGAHVILAVRDAKRGDAAVEALRQAAPGALFERMALDVSSLASVRAFAAAFKQRTLETEGDRRDGIPPLDLLVNNAGIMMLPTRELSVDGFELQMATNHLGHFALTLLLLPCLLKSAAPRVVTVASVVAWFAAKLPESADKFDFKKDRGYGPRTSYAESKLSNLLFSQELGRRFPQLVSVAAHPGGSATNLHQHAFSSVKWMMQSSEAGALPSLRAAVDPEAASGGYYGPQGVFMGSPTKATIPWGARSHAIAGALWAASEQATGVTCTSPLLPRSPVAKM